MIARLLALLACSFFGAGCLPIPTNLKVADPMAGTIRVAGEPLAGAEVHLGDANDLGTDCEAKLITRTDTTGHFAFGEQQEHVDFIIFMADYFPADRLCFKVPNRPLVATWTFQSLERGDHVECELGPSRPRAASHGEKAAQSLRTVGPTSGYVLEGCRLVAKAVKPKP